MKKLLTLILILPLLHFSQYEVQNAQLDKETSAKLLELVDELLTTEVTVSFNITYNDLKSNYDDMDEGDVKGKEYIDSLITEQKRDQENPLLLSTIASYYDNKKKPNIAQAYYTKALKYVDNLDTDDSAFYYSFKGILKSNINDSTAIDDFRKAVEINPNDSLTTIFFPIILLNDGAYKEAKKLLKKQLRKDPRYPAYSIFQLAMVEIFDAIQESSTIINTSEEEKNKYFDKNYDEIIDFTSVNRYLKKHKKDEKIKNLEITTNLLAIFSKVIFLEKDSGEMNLKFTPYEKDKLKELIKQINKQNKKKKINPFTANKCLGIAYFLLQDNEQSIKYYRKSIDAFPQDKRSDEFNETECIEAITAIYFMNKQFKQYKASLFERISNEKIEANNADEYMHLAYEYYRTDSLDLAEEYCNKTREYDPDNFEMLRLLTHLNFLKNFDFSTRIYGDKAEKNMRNDIDGCHLFLQFAIYDVYTKDFETAKLKIDAIKKVDVDGVFDTTFTLEEIIRKNS